MKSNQIFEAEIMCYRTSLKQIAILTIAILFSVAAAESVESESSCTTLPKEQRFSAAGYELGTCYNEVEALVKSKGHTLHEFSMPDNINIPDEMNFPKNYPLIKAYNSDFVDVVPPLKDQIESDPSAQLHFYKNQLYDISVLLSYPQEIGSKNLKKIPDIIAKKITERIGILPVFNEDSKNLEWYFENVKVSLYELSTLYTDPYILIHPLKGFLLASSQYITLIYQ